MTDPISTFFGIIFFGAFFMVVVGLIIGAALFSMRKSKNYRKYLTDMYVSSRIRELASIDKLDMNQEEINFKSWCKKEEIERNRFDLDNSIEEELIEKVNTRKEEKKAK